MFIFFISTPSFSLNTWIQQTNGSNLWPDSGYFQQCYFISSLEGYVVADNGKMAKTTTRGRTWEVVPTGTTDNLIDISVISSGGSTQIMPITTNIFSSTLETPAYFRKTTNNGSTWSQYQLSDYYLSGIWFANVNAGCVVGWKDIGDPSYNVWITSDGGTSWTPFDLVSPGSDSTSDAITGVDGLSANNIWVTGALSAGVYPDRFRPVSYGKWNGSTWSVSSISNTDYCGVDNRIRVIDNNTAWIVGSAFNKVDGVTFYNAFRTTDGGTTWSKMEIGGSESNGGNRFHNIWFVDSNNGWAVGEGWSGSMIDGNPGEIYYTTNGGVAASDWTRETRGTLPDDINGCTGLFFTDANNGWVIGGGGIYKYVLLPEISTVSTSSAVAGSTFNMTITGTNFQGTGGIDVPSISLGSGITINSVSLSGPTQLTANITISSDATIEVLRDLILTNPDLGSATKAAAFSVSPSSTTPPTTTTTTEPPSLVIPQYTNGQGWNPLKDGDLTVNFTSSAAVQAKIFVLSNSPPFAIYTRTIPVTLGTNKTILTQKPDFGDSYPNGIYKIKIIPVSSGTPLASGKLTVTIFNK